VKVDKPLHVFFRALTPLDVTMLWNYMDNPRAMHRIRSRPHETHTRLSENATNQIAWRCLMLVGWIIPLMLATTAPAASDLRQLLDAIRQVETGGKADPANAVGDGGRSLGPYQITRAYWRDSGVPGKYQQVRSKAYAERVMTAYWKRYCPTALARGDWQTLARVHNGGPNGRSEQRTSSYWRRVREQMR